VKDTYWRIFTAQALGGVTAVTNTIRRQKISEHGIVLRLSKLKNISSDTYLLGEIKITAIVKH
jgi:hypothetical protein